MARTFSLEQTLPPPVIGPEFLRKLENEMRLAAQSAGCRFPTFRFSIVDGVGVETFDSVADDAVPLRLAQFHSAHLALESEQDGFSISLDLESFGGDAQLKVQMTGNHAREEALQFSARIREMVIATNSGAPGENQVRYFFRGNPLPSVEFSLATVKILKDNVVRLCASYCEVDPGIIRVETEMTLEKGTTFQNVTINELERTGFPADIKSFKIKCECTGARRLAMIELEFSRDHADTLAQVMAAGSGAEEFATNAYRDLIRSLERAHTRHGWLFIGSRHAATAFVGGIVTLIAADVAWDSDFIYAKWILIFALIMVFSPFLAYLVPYTQFDNSRLRARVRIVNWLLLGIAGYGLKAALEPLFGG